jgi:hypothetical protein
MTVHYENIIIKFVQGSIRYNHNNSTEKMKNFVAFSSHVQAVVGDFSKKKKPVSEIPHWV